MIGRFLRHPLPYLALLIGLAYWNAEASGWLRPQITNDTQSYEHLLKATTVAEALSGLRTYGYPLVIRTFGLERDGWAAVPRFHFALYGLAILVFWLAVSRFTRSRWLAFAAAAPLCFASARQHIQMVVTDSIAESLGLMTVSLLLLLITGRGRALTAPLLGLAVLIAYWNRPIYQFLVVLVPLLGAALHLIHAPRVRFAPVRWTLGLAALTFVPLLGMSAVRWATVGQFGVSSFSGYHIGTIGALMLDDKLVAEMPDDPQRLAREILDERKRQKRRPMRWSSWSGHSHSDFNYSMFAIVEPITRDFVLEEEGRVLREDRSTDLGPLDIPGMMGPTALAMDRRLGELGRAAIFARPHLYVKWVVEAIRSSVAKIFKDRWLCFLLALLALSIPVLLVRAAREPTLFERPWGDRALSLLGLALVGSCYFLGHTLIIALVHWPQDRYAAAANLLLPALVGAGLFELWRWILPRGEDRRRRATLPIQIASVSLAFLLCGLLAEIFFQVVGFDFDRQERRIAQTPIFYRKPRVPTGPVFFHRAGPAVWKGPVLEGGDDVEVQYDEGGFRNPSDLTDWEIVVVGDGFVESGYLPQDKIFTSKLGRRSGLRVKNLGTSHTGTLTQIHYLETWGKAASTRQAVLVFNEGDDLDDLQREASDLYWFQERGRRNYRRSTPQSSLLQAVSGPLARLGSAGREEAKASARLRANTDLLFPGQDEALRIRIFQRVPGRGHLTEKRIQRLEGIMRRWATSARALGLEPWILYIPCKHRILHPYLRYDADVPEPIRRWRPTDLPNLVRTIAAENDIGFLDPGPRLARATKNGTMVYNPIDIHLSEAGSHLMGRFLALELGEENAPEETVSFGAAQNS